MIYPHPNIIIKKIARISSLLPSSSLMKTQNPQNSQNLHFSSPKQKSYLFRVDKQFLKQLQTCEEMVIAGQPSDESIILSDKSCFIVKGVHISTTLLLMDQKGAILQQSMGYLDIQKFTPYFNEIYQKIMSISYNNPIPENNESSFEMLVDEYGFTKEAIKKQCYISEEEFQRISKAMNLVKISQSGEVQLFLHVPQILATQVLRQIIKIHNQRTKNLLRALEFQVIFEKIAIINKDILQKIAKQFYADIETEQGILSFKLSIKSIVMFILSEMSLAKKYYNSYTFDEVLDEMLMVYMPVEAQMSVSAMKEGKTPQMKQLYDLRYLFFIVDKTEKYAAYDYMQIETDVNARLKFLATFKNRWRAAELKAIFRGIDSTDNGKYLPLSDVLLKKFRKYGQEYEIKFILPQK